MRVDEITLDWLYARTIERDGCLIWAGCYGRNGTQPQATIDSKPRPVGRVIWELVHGRPVPTGCRVGPVCEVPGCVHPEHLLARKPGAVARGRPLPIAHRINIAEAKRATSKLAQEAVREIRSSDESGPVLAAAHGIDLTYVHMIKRGEVRRDYGGHFAGLGAQR
jgi:hypothetical protein